MLWSVVEVVMADFHGLKGRFMLQKNGCNAAQWTKYGRSDRCKGGQVGGWEVGVDTMYVDGRGMLTHRVGICASGMYTHRVCMYMDRRVFALRGNLFFILIRAEPFIST